MLYANSLRNKLPETWVPGIQVLFQTNLAHRCSIYGFKLTFQQVLAIGLPAITADLIIVAGTLALGILNGKITQSRQPDSLNDLYRQCHLRAAAVLGAEPVVRCEAHKTAVAYPPW